MVYPFRRQSVSPRLKAIVGIGITALVASLAGGGAVASATPGTPVDLTVFAGTGTSGTPLAGAATSSAFNTPTGIAVDPSGNVYVADSSNNVVEKITPAGVLSIFAGTGTQGTPTTGPAVSSDLNDPNGVAADSAGDVFIADTHNRVIEKVTPAGVLSIVAGDGTQAAPTVGPAISSPLNNPYGLAVDSAGNIFIADTNNDVIEKVDTAGNLSVIAGSGTDGAPTAGPATSSDLSAPIYVAVDGADNVYIADSNHGYVEKVTAAGVLSIFAGQSGFGPPTPGPATNSHLSFPTGVAVDSAGDVYIADDGNNLVERVDPAGNLSFVAGTGTAGTPTNGLATSSDLSGPGDIAFDSSGIMYVDDTNNNVVERVTPVPSAPVFTADTPPMAARNVAYSYTFVATGFPPPAYSVSSGSLPPGLTLNPTTGVLSGTPIGSGSFTVSATNSAGTQTTAVITITLPAQPMPPVPELVPTGGSVAATPAGGGYWSLSPTGELSAHGDAPDLGSENTAALDSPVVSVSSTSSGDGYWLAAADGGVFSFGDAHFHGSLGGTRLNQPITGMAQTPDDGGYWLVGADGGVFAFGDARFSGSLGSANLNQPITGITSTPDGGGYWLAGADGGVFAFGDARFFGSMGGTNLNQHVVGIASTTSGHGYWLVAADGGVFSFGDAAFHGSLGATGTTQIAGIVANGNAGYRLITSGGNAVSFGSNP